MKTSTLSLNARRPGYFFSRIFKSLSLLSFTFFLLGVSHAEETAVSTAAVSEPTLSTTTAVSEPTVTLSTPTPITQATSTISESPVVLSTPSVNSSTATPEISMSTEPVKSMDQIVRDMTGVPEGGIILDKVEINDSGNRLLVMIHTSEPADTFVFERSDPPSLFIQFLGTAVYAGGEPVQMVGIDPLTEVRYGYTNFTDASSAGRDGKKKYQIDYLELRLSRPVFYHVQRQGWIVVVGLDRTTTRVEIPELDFRFDTAQYEGAASLPENPGIKDFVLVAQNNSQLLSVAREEAELANRRVFEAQRAMLPGLTARASATRGREENPFASQDFEGFESAAFRRDEYGMEVTQPIYQSGRLYRGYRQAKINKQMALENVRKQAQDLTYEMKKAYVTLLKNQGILRIRRELVAQGEVLKNMVRDRADLQLASQAEVLNVSAQADQASYQLTGDEQDVQLARLVVISLLNQGDPVPDPVPGALAFGRLSFNVESIINWAQEHRPDVRIARLNAEMARNNWKASKAENGFRVDASGFYGRAGAAFDDDDEELDMEESWNIGVRLSKAFWGNTLRASYNKEDTAPDLGQVFFTESSQKTVELGLLDAMPGDSNARQARLQYEKAQAELVEAARKAEYEVREAYFNLEKSARQLEAVREDMTFRKKDLEITREKVKLGLAEISQVIAAEVAHAEAQVKEQEALSTYNISLANMDRVAGAEVVRD